MVDTKSITPISIEKTQQSRLESVDFNNLPFGSIYSDHMFTVDYEDGEWKNARVMPFGSIEISPAMCSIHYGQSIFEGLKAYRSGDDVLIFRPDENHARLNSSAERMCMPSLPQEIFFDGLRSMLELDRNWIPTAEGSSLYIRPFMFASEAFLGVRAANRYKFMIITCPVGAYYSEPVRVKVETKFVRAVEGGTGYAKAAGNYAASIYPAQLAQKEGYHQLLWTDAKSHTQIEESGTMNVVFQINDKIITAPTGDTILSGITRKSVLELLRDKGIEVEERKPEVKEVLEAAENGTLKEAFGVGTAATISQIKTIGFEGKDYELPPVENRPLSAELLQDLEDLKRGRTPDTKGWIFKF